MKTHKSFVNKLLALVLGMLLIGCQENEVDSSFSLYNLEPVILKKTGNEIHQYWELENSDVLWETEFVSGVALAAYKDSLHGILGNELFQRTINKEATQKSRATLSDTANGDQINAHLIHTGELGEIRKIHLLEAELLNYQLGRYQLLKHPTEFHAFVLFNESSDLVRVYFGASDQPWPPRLGTILEAVVKDLRNGWHIKYDLHNHYEPEANNYLGILAPSMSDAQIFKAFDGQYGMEKALITNGFYTVVIDSSEFKKFEAHGD